MISLQERQRANDTLFGASEEDSNDFFNLNHNLQAYNDLVKQKYSDSVAEDILASPAPSTADFSASPAAPFYSPVNLSTGTAQLDSYYMPEQQKVPQKQDYELESYHNDANPLPAPSKTFRPKIFDMNLEEINFDRAEQIKADLDTAHEQMQAEKASEETELVTNFKLNAKGMVALIGFIAVTVLVIALIIVNSLGIAGTNARIQNLEASNLQMSQEINTKTYQRNQKFAAFKQDAYQTVYAVDGTVREGYTEITIEPIKGSGWTPLPDTDKTTNWFNDLCTFFSNLFM